MAGPLITALFSVASEIVSKGTLQIGREKDGHNRRRSNNSIRSLTAESNKLVAGFPVMMSRSLSPQIMYLLNKALERKYATELKLVMENVISGTDNTVSQFLSRFHDMSGGDSVHVKLHPQTQGWTFGDAVDNYVVECMYKDISLLEEYGNMTYFEQYNHNLIGEASSHASRTAMTTANNQPDGIIKGMHKNVGAYFTDMDVKKANELQPTTFTISVSFSEPSKKEYNQKDMTIGVKTRLVPIESEAMVINMHKAVQNDRTLFNFFRATTGEISMIKDFLLMSNQIKDNVANDSPIWNRLRVNKIKNAINNVLKYRTGLIPNTSIVLSMSEVEYIKAEYKIDLMDKNNVMGIIKQYFLKALIIADEATEMLYMVDETANFDQMTFQALSKEVDKSSDLKSIISLMKTRN